MRTAWLRHAGLGVVLALAASSLSCHVNEYCLNCDIGDGGNGDGGSGGGMDGSGSGGSGMDGSACVPSIEICDGIDNDCDGKIDEDIDVGSNICNQVGACSGAVPECVEHGSGSADIECSKKPTAEICDNIDNDCDGIVDNNNPLVDSMGVVHGAKCGNGVGECKQGNNLCTNGTINCVGAVGPSTEVCDGKDNDCDGTIDNGLSNLGTCGTDNTAPCHFGTLECIGGGVVCIGDAEPEPEICDGIDNDCDGVIDNGFNKQTDPRNCGSCNHVCSFPNAVAGCSAGNCVIAACQPGFHDIDKNPANGCEYACNVTGSEVCDGVDNDCDGQIDNGVTAPNGLCDTKGLCAGATASCEGSAGFVCDYGPGVQLGSNGQPLPQESLCDGLDNDCDGRVDEGTPNLGASCQVGTCKLTGGDCFGSGDCTGTGNTCLFAGVCGGKGHFICDPSNAAGPAICKVDTHGKKPGAEVCNNLDDDCDGAIDNGGATGSLVGQNWVNIGNNNQMMEFEASKPDASSTDQGNVTAGTTCAQAGVQPWTDLTYPEAEAACSAVGARLCTEQEWHRTCSVIAPLAEVSPASTQYPIALPSSGSITTTIEAEDYAAITFANDTTLGTCSIDTDVCDVDNNTCAANTCRGGGTKHCSLTNATCTGTGNGTCTQQTCNSSSSTVPHAWVEDYTAGFSGISDMEALPDVGSFVSAADALTKAPHLDYTFKFQKATEAYHVWALLAAPASGVTTGTSELVYVGVDGATPVAITTGATNPAFAWETAASTFTIAPGNHTLNVYMGQDGVRLDAIQITDTTTTPTLPTNSKGNNWAYATNANTFQPTTCNGEDFSSADDNIQPTGNEASCFATTGTDVFDLSGNVKEWTQARLPGENPIRGGASDDSDQGISCPLDFTLADDSFFFPNVGFRCCRTHP
nr:MopE-related protein [Kofleriaceae bacterium]